MGIGTRNYKELRGKEVYIFCEEEGSWSDLFITPEWSKMLNFMKERVVPDLTVKVFYGFLSDVTYIPNDRSGLNTYVVVTSPDDEDKGCCLEVATTETEDQIAAAIEHIISGSGGLGVFSVEEIEIDNIFFLFGEELTLYVSADPHGTDEDVLCTAENIIKKIAAATADDDIVEVNITNEQE